MINRLLFISLAPVLIIALYIYSRDKYEKEPLPALLRALFAGVFIVLPVVLIEGFLTRSSEAMEGIAYAAYTAFAVAGLTEEAMKYLAFIIFFWNNRNFNEKFDGIVYSVYISMGFEAIENLIYVFSGGYAVGIVRALTAVPAHALFGIMMGYYFSRAKFEKTMRPLHLLLAFLMPFAFHGLYNFLLMSNTQVLLTLFVPVFIYYWVTGFKKMAVLSDQSSFRNIADNTDQIARDQTD